VFFTDRRKRFLLDIVFWQNMRSALAGGNVVRILRLVAPSVSNTVDYFHIFQFQPWLSTTSNTRPISSNMDIGVCADL
jgi:hypothetical protein